MRHHQDSLPWSSEQSIHGNIPSHLLEICQPESLPQVMMPDNASRYLSAAEELTKLLQSDDLTTSLGAHGVVWKFIPKKAQWFEGFWEWMIGLTKHCLKKVLGRSYISLPVLQTMIAEVEAVLNNRLLTYTSVTSMTLNLSPLHASCIAGRLLDYHMNTMLKTPKTLTTETNHNFEDRSRFRPTSWRIFNHDGYMNIWHH